MAVKEKTKKSAGLVAGIAIGVVCLVFIIFFAATANAVTPAYLNVETGTVMVDTGSGWVPATNGMELSPNDRVKTGSDGEASVMLYESAIVGLDPNTEVSIAELSKEKTKIRQESGETWNKFTKMNGMEGLEVETPGSVATVRGTEFGVSMDGVQVMEGNVETEDKATGKKYSVPAGQKAERLAGKLALADLSEKDREKYIAKMEKNIKRLEHLAEKQMKKQEKKAEHAEKKTEQVTEQEEKKMTKKAKATKKEIEKQRERLEKIKNNKGQNKKFSEGVSVESDDAEDVSGEEAENDSESEEDIEIVIAEDDKKNSNRKPEIKSLKGPETKKDD